MTETLLVMLALVLGVVLGYRLARLQPVHVAVDVSQPVPTPAAVPALLPRVARNEVIIRLLDEHEDKELGSLRIDARARKPVLVFQGDRFECVDEQGGTFRYRRHAVLSGAVA